ncbi:LysR family transcriptional regulator [Aquamicrobium sp. NLF2-7]|jgi:DNA-binding transcriptional LysR family regulator|uniref:DNA-binding transcriptional LysR family regulator n=1 Tax=Aquamicrobium lusatiense TaxID=89772 RepID=A0A7W9VVZ3_9HYPH|nr:MULTISPECIES: LysR family transcriptional regulator [Aquamicrobium]MBB6014389.1 DNA-binding transcriptional LysR family regulator [Aquamicrobium lusatiense]MCG8271045.1 LysR family transcriptional regulator [Aquamicrobium sp. NLF2-7]MCK9550674.1 LysR family transcriptional regulator [Aquamicrobium sp.]MDH4990745.1 LysR family transcriptional regulator [Aquamicrobium lusatiense]
MALDWDKLRVFHAAAQAGSFTHAAETLHLSQSAISRQVSALEHDVGVPLFHRHARGLVLTEQGEMLFRTAHDVLMKLESIRSRLLETKDHPTGVLRVTTTVGLGTGWLTDRTKEFLELYPEINLQLVFTNEELDLTMRQADCAVRLRQPQQPDLIQRRLFTVHLHVFASQEYLDRHGVPKSAADLDRHRIITFGEPVPSYLAGLNTLETVGRPDGEKRPSVLQINDLMSIRKAVKRGVGIAMLPDYMSGKDSGLVSILEELEGPSFDTFFVYPEAMKNQAKLKAFRDFMFSKARNWSY